MGIDSYENASNQQEKLSNAVKSKNKENETHNARKESLGPNTNQD